MASSRKCHQGPCGPCFLCHNQSMKYTHPEKFDDAQYTFLCAVENKSIDKYVCICYACSKQLNRNINNPKFEPRWKAKPNKAQSKCSIQNCENAACKNTSLASADEIEQLIGKPIVAFSVEEGVSTVRLCQVHYNHLYIKLNLSAPCESCGGKPRKGEKFNRHCPEPDTINTYLATVCGDSCYLTKESLICTACYIHFKEVLRNVQQGKQTLKTAMGESISERNADITTAISLCSSKIHTIYANRESITMSDYLEYVVCLVCKKVGEHMIADEALLLPTLHTHMANEVLANATCFPQLNVSEQDIPTSRWLLSRLHFYFENQLEAQCRHRRYGTLLFHKRCDLVQALSTALGKNETFQRRVDKLINSDSSVQTQQPSVSIEEQAHNVAIHLNGKLHERVRAINANFSEKPQCIASTSLATTMANTDPFILNFLKTVTQSVRQSKRKLFETSMDVSTKNIRLLYALSVLQFSTNNTCSAPFHIPLTEAVLCHGGTLELVRILNRLGAVASIDTVNRLATQVVQARLSQGIKPDLHPHMFAAVSIDNVDILQPYGFVSCQDATRSWHGTSVQCVQPLPVSGHLTSADLLSQDIGQKRLPTSPAGTPIPTVRHKRRRRTLTELPSPHTTVVIHTQPEPFNAATLAEYSTSTTTLHLEEFKLNAIEQSTLKNLQSDLFRSIVLRHFGSTESTHPFPALPSLVNCIRKQSADREVSNVTYVEITSERADSKPTLIGVIARIQQTFVQELNQKHVIVVGDAKTYNLLQEICYEYKSHLKWLIPFPGDWHVLFNYQKALMKPYADAGLASLGKASGHRAETLTSLIQASHFRRTHEFLLQAFEALYRYFISLYVAHLSDSESTGEGRTYGQDIMALISDLVCQFTGLSSDDDLDTFRHIAKQTFESEKMPLTYTGFRAYMENLSEQHDTVRFWYQFIEVDCFAYIALFLALRYRNWELRVGSIKVLAATFSAFDRPIYQELIPHHLKDILKMPPNVLHHLQKGGFSVRLSPTEWHGVALDECHEMKINKDAKLAVVHPSKHKMEFLSNYMSFRAACVDNLTKQLFPERAAHTNAFSHTPTSKDKKRDTNIQHMLDAIQNKGMLTVSGLWNIFELKQATPEQAHDLLNFRKIGQEAFEGFISTKVLGLPSTTAPTRRKRLCTFSVTKTQKQKIKLVEQERKMSQRYLKRQLAWISEQGAENLDLNSLFGPISVLPRALIGKDGLPYKGTKSNTTEYLRKRYSALPIISQSLPPQWIAHSCILEGMFMIQTSPLPTMSSMQEYTRLLLNQYVRPHFRAGVQEVHVVFDSPGSMRESPKELEQRRRDSGTEQRTENHKCVPISSSTTLPTKWRDLLACRRCKQCLTEYVAQEMLILAPQILNSAQSFVTNVGEVAYCATSTGERLPCPQLWTNADEADLRVWLHCVNSIGTRKLIFSPDTDVYHAGLTVAPLVPEGEIIVQLSKTFKQGSKFLNLTRLLQALQSDPDLLGIPSLLRPQALQTLYVCTGCDYVSFFAGMGKVSFLSTFYQYASFIAGGVDAPGSIGECSLDLISSNARLSFLRLVGCAYFRAHASAFELSSPITLYHSIMANDVLEHHDKWLGVIRKTVWLRADAESKNMPSTEALTLHWSRCSWVIGMWHKAIQNDIDMPGLDTFGWTRKDGQLEVVWDTAENQAEARERIDFVLKGCKCKTGCTSNRCKCKKNMRMCGPGCQCLNCLNMTAHQKGQALEEVHHMELECDVHNWESDEYVDESDEDLELYNDEEVNNVMDLVFGMESDTEENY